MIIGNKILHKKAIKSSLEWAKSCIETEPDGTIFLADFIENAKGRGERKWKCYEGQLSITILLKPNFSPKFNLENQINYLTMLFSIAIANSMSDFNITIKWPNDFILNDKKMGGMITELIWKNQIPAAIIIGIGLNINNRISADDELFAIATSLKNEYHKDFDKTEILNKIIQESNYLYDLWKQQAFELIFEKWKEKQFYLNKKIKIHNNDGTLIEGLVTNFYANGDLEIINKEQTKEIVPFYQVDNISIK